jgi:hypothetical protein
MIIEHERLDSLIEQMSLPTGGRENQKRARTRIYIGLRKVQGGLPA